MWFLGQTVRLTSVNHHPKIQLALASSTLWLGLWGLSENRSIAEESQACQGRKALTQAESRQIRVLGQQGRMTSPGSVAGTGTAALS